MTRQTIYRMRYFSPGSLPRWNNSGWAVLFTWSCVVTFSIDSPGQKFTPWKIKHWLPRTEIYPLKNQTTIDSPGQKFTPWKIKQTCLVGTYRKNLCICWVTHLKCSKTCLMQPLKNRQTKFLMTNGSLMKVESIAECSSSFVDHLWFFCLVFVMPLCASVSLCLVVTCWERAGFLALVCGV